MRVPRSQAPNCLRAVGAKSAQSKMRVSELTPIHLAAANTDSSKLAQLLALAPGEVQTATRSTGANEPQKERVKL